jgi:hypothetical protein
LSEFGEEIVRKQEKLEKIHVDVLISGQKYAIEKYCL